MAGWDDGYVTDVIYTRNAQKEMTPCWLAATAVLLGHRPPGLAAKFRYADLGCGHGLTATIAAATCPHAEVWGFDFNPAHIESARRLAAAAGLTNVHFQEASFADLAGLPPSALPEFDFIVSHGVLSWISAENRDRLIHFIGHRLRPGGLAYLSYNVTTGWAAMVPIRALMRMLMQQTPGRSDQAASGVLDYLDTLKDAGARFFGTSPAIESRLADMRRQDMRYIAHEFLNADWQPLMFADMAAAMAGVKCNFIGSATLTENLDAVSVPTAMMNLVNKASDPILRETLRDFGLAQTFRRDVYRRGVLPLTGPEHVRLLDEIELAWTGRHPDDPISLGSPLGPVQGLSELYRPLMDMVMAENASIGGIRRAEGLATRSMGDISQAVSLLMGSDYLHPVLPASVRSAGRAGSVRLNAAIGGLNADGADITQMAAPSIGGPFSADILETLFVREMLSGGPIEIEALTDRIVAGVAQAGRTLQRDGRPIGDAGDARKIVWEAATKMLERRQPLLKGLGVLE